MRYVICLFTVLLLAGSNNDKKGELIFVEANIEKGFHHPYYLFIPDGMSSSTESFILIEPNNTGSADDDFQKHLESAKRTASRDFYLGNYIAQKLDCPLIVPVFPRPKSDWKTYSHALDRDVMLQKENSLERIDKQLIDMFKDARSRLQEKQIDTHKRFLLTGFSASGTFANRFTLIHPDKVFAVAAGGVNGLLMMPTDSIQGKELDYPIGTNDFEKLFHKDFQKDVFAETHQFYFMGENDDNDAIPYSDGYDDDERDLIYGIMGKEMQPKRWAYCQEFYKNEGINAVLKTYQNTGHEHPDSIKDEVVHFFENCISKD